MDGVNPGIDPSFTRVDLLSASDKADDDSPILVAIHAGN